MNIKYLIFSILILFVSSGYSQSISQNQPIEYELDLVWDVDSLNAGIDFYLWCDSLFYEKYHKTLVVFVTESKDGQHDKKLTDLYFYFDKPYRLTELITFPKEDASIEDSAKGWHLYKWRITISKVKLASLIEDYIAAQKSKKYSWFLAAHAAIRDKADKNLKANTYVFSKKSYKKFWRLYRKYRRRK